MFKVGTEADWFCSYGLDLNIDFCFWILEVDGLHVPPFTHHAEGNGALRALGMDATSWLTWTQNVIQQHDQQKYTTQRESVRLTNETWRAFNADPTAPKGDNRQRMLAFQQRLIQAKRERNILIPEFTDPSQSWQGNTDIQEQLKELWKQYRLISHKRSAWETNMARQWQQAASKGPVPDLWHELEPYHNRLPSLFIHFVPYPVQLDYIVAPFSVIMTVVNGQLDRDIFSKRALQAAAALAQKNQR